MAPRRPIEDERNELVLKELEFINTTIKRLEGTVEKLGEVFKALTVQLVTQEGDLKMLRYQMGRTTAIWSLISGAVASTIVGAILALIMKH